MTIRRGRLGNAESTEEHEVPIRIECEGGRLAGARSGACQLVPGVAIPGPGVVEQSTSCAPSTEEDELVEVWVEGHRSHLAGGGATVCDAGRRSHTLPFHSQVSSDRDPSEASPPNSTTSLSSAS